MRRIDKSKELCGLVRRAFACSEHASWLPVKSSLPPAVSIPQVFISKKDFRPKYFVLQNDVSSSIGEISVGMRGATDEPQLPGTSKNSVETELHSVSMEEMKALNPEIAAFMEPSSNQEEYV